MAFIFLTNMAVLKYFLPKQRHLLLEKSLLLFKPVLKKIYSFSNTTKNRYLLVSTVLYLALPSLVFFSTWLQWYITLPLVIGLSYAILKLVSPKSANVNAIQFNKGYLFTLALLAVFISWYVGIGNFQPQIVDYNKHHAVFRDLLLKQWPVMYDNHKFVNEPVFLDYYLAWYIIPAFLGKLTNGGLVEIYTLIWSSIGLFLAFCYLSTITNNKKYWVILLLILFGDLENAYAVLRFLINWFVLGSYNLGLLFSELLANDIIFDNRTPSYATFLTQYEWAPQHTLAIFLTTPLLIQNYFKKNSGDYSILILGLTLLWSPFVSIGLLPFILLLFIKKPIYFLTIENLIGILICLTISFYYLAHIPQPVRWLWDTFPHINFIIKYPIFLVIKFGLLSFFTFLIVKRHTDLKWLAIAVIVVLSTFPLVFIGENADFAMRATGPAWYAFIFLIIKAIDIKVNLNLKYTFFALLLLSCFRYYFNGPHRTKKSHNESIDSATTLTLIDEKEWFNTQYFGKTDSFFFKYLAKKHE